VSIYHASADTADHLDLGQVRACFEAALVVLTTSAGSLRAAIVNRWTARHLERRSDHMLRDLGFERDWDGTIRRLPDAE